MSATIDTEEEDRAVSVDDSGAAGRPRPRPRPGPAVESAVEPAVESVVEPAPDAGRRRLRITRWGVLVAALVLALAAGGWTVYHYATRPDPRAVTPAVNADGAYRVGTIPSAAGQAALRTIARELPRVLAYDYRSLDEGRDAAAKLMTASFRRTYLSTFDKAVRPTAVAQKAVTRALVRGAGLVSTSGPDKATCLVFVDQLLVPATGDKQAAKISQNRVTVVMQKVDGTWLIDGLTPF